ncbi:TPA: hypothetical protein SIA62_004103 [Pseudomonas aeruginosa]|uniref:hypothetical protein n=1 Tax=Pseudomonas aeruginosa TaxID=287 RepID=UPI00053E7FB9|nr:hypothetical protein [Pseudomonas aeruginosa]KSK28958.1 hypothetical protein APA27_05480 [Pseudomonas aeruginosa]KSM68927.1 hypothetical protein APA74_05050 [Pseudomonas aeruginosa]KSO64893.1 hypothetical protein APA97_04650 [Pseudomonas aeruginosa]MCT5584593.1 hypothetical protein [Pseudomonas aeruginosa]MDG3698436.1 hypothetical protein [Pseudomonas aeruginosa]
MTAFREITLAQARAEELERTLQAKVKAADHGSSHITVMHAIEKAHETLAGTAPVAQAGQVRDGYSLNFILSKHRQVIVEVLPGNWKDIYVEQGCMGEVKYPAATVCGDISTEKVLEVKRRAIDLAMQRGDANGS